MSITSEIQIVVEMTISAGKLDAFKMLQEVIDTVKTEEPGILAYQFYFNSDESKCYSLEWYKDSQSALSHLEKVGPDMQKMSELFTATRFEVFGNPSPELEKALTGFGVGASFFKYWTGFNRFTM
jgi:quinol monooxygenase YgiN